MKPKTLTLVSITIIAALLIGAFAFTAFAPPAIIGANVSWNPKTYTWDGPVSTWDAKISLKGGHKGDEIDITTILLEGTFSPINTGTIVHGKLIIGFDGNQVKIALASKITHFIPGIYRISLTITGRLLTGEDWAGDGIITVTIPNPPPP